MNLDLWLKFGHIVAAMVWIGGGLMLSLMGARARASRDPNAIGEFARTLSYFGPRVLTPAVLAVLVFGIWMVLENAAWDFAQGWILIALGLFVIAFFIGVIFLSRLGIALKRMAGAGESDSGAGRALLGRWLIGYRIVLLVLVAAVWDMVFKPGL